jgi:hypothetical protein
MADRRRIQTSPTPRIGTVAYTLPGALHGGSGFRDDPASETVPGLAAGIRLEIVRLTVNDQCRAFTMEERILPLLEAHHWRPRDDYADTIGCHQQVREIARMGPLGVSKPVFRPLGIEVLSRRLEVGSLALPGLMDVKTVVPWGQVLDMRHDGDTVDPLS